MTSDLSRELGRRPVGFCESGCHPPLRRMAQTNELFPTPAEDGPRYPMIQHTPTPPRTQAKGHRPAASASGTRHTSSTVGPHGPPPRAAAARPAPWHPLNPLSLSPWDRFYGTPGRRKNRLIKVQPWSRAVLRAETQGVCSPRHSMALPGRAGQCMAHSDGCGVGLSTNAQEWVPFCPAVF